MLRLTQLLTFALTLVMGIGSAFGQPSFSSVASGVQPKVVKIFGAGGIRGLEAYQSGFLVSNEGHVLTVMSYVLDTDLLSVVLSDGRKLEGKLLGADPRLEIALVKVDVKGLDHFNLAEAATVEPGDRVLAFSNLYGVATGDELNSVLHGIVSAKTKLAARRGAYQSPYKGPVYVLDAITNNPGAAGGAITDRRGRLVGMIGKELRNAQNNIWLNYALPISELVGAVDDIIAGKVRPISKGDERKRPAEAHSLKSLGITLVPDVLARTPPFIERVKLGSVANKQGLKSDDLILYVNDRVVDSCKTIRDELSYIDRIDEVRILVQRGQDLVEVSLKAPR